MLDQMSSRVDDAVDPAVVRGVEPASAGQFRSRRELREAEAQAARRGGSRAASTALRVEQVSPVPHAPVALTPAAPVAPASVVASSKAPRAPRKNPASVLLTMAVVGGMFAVAGLPAYATQELDPVAATTDSGEAQTLSVGAEVAAAVAQRDGFKATTPEQLAQLNEDAIRAANNAAYVASGARALGDDYPWPYELTDDQGGGLSPLNYYFRECVDFVAWRINRDQGYYAAPFKWVWSNLTPYGGNGGQWMYNWESLGRTVSNTPIVGAVAYTGGNHIAYVKSVNGDGTVTLEEYNYIPGMYGQRTLPASSVVAFLYPPS